MKSHSPGPTPAGLGARVPHPRGLVEVFGKGSSVAGWAPQDEGTKGPFSRPQRLHDLGSPWQWEGSSAREWKEGRGGSRTPFPTIHLLSAGTDPPGQTRGSSGPGLGRGGGSMEQPPPAPSAAWQRAPLEGAQLALGSCFTRHKTFGFHGLAMFSVWGMSIGLPPFHFAK